MSSILSTIFISGSLVLWQSIKRNLYRKFADRKMMVGNQGKYSQDNKLSRANFTNTKMPTLSKATSATASQQNAGRPQLKKPRKSDIPEIPEAVFKASSYDRYDGSP